MGGLYTLDGLRCCDICGRSCRDGAGHTVLSDAPKPGYREIRHACGVIIRYARRVRLAVRVSKCPYNWCPPTAACTDCRRSRKHLHCASQAAYCRRRSEEFDAEIRAEAKRKPEVLC